jgi:hypothetical protein
MDASMTRNRDELIATWLQAERAGEPEAADLRLSRAMRALGRTPPRPGFADRVLAAAGVVRPAPGLLASRWVRAATVCAIALAGVGPLLLPLGPLLTQAPSYWARLLAASVGWVASGADAARVLLNALRLIVQVGDAIQLAAATPPVLAATAVSLVVATGSLAALGRLLAPRKELRCS